MNARVSYHDREGGWIDVEITVAPLGKFVPLLKFDARWAMFFRRENRRHDTYLPTELVVRKPELVQPQRGRIFDTGMLVYGDKAVDYNWLRDHYARMGERWGGSSNHEAVMLVEVYGCHGDDGHVDYSLEGYRFIGEKALEARDGWRGTMDAMLMMPSDDEALSETLPSPDAP